MVDKDDVSYSVFLEEKNDSNTILQKKVYKWVDNDAVTLCFLCSKQFTLFVRKHHCRFCGKIFCGECVNYQASIPTELLSADSAKGTWNEYLSSYIFAKDPTIYKVCKKCNDLIQFIDSVKKIIELFFIIKPDIKFLKKAGIICKSWYNASNYILSIFREIQYKLSNCEYTDIEKTLLWSNRDFIRGHNKYMLHLFKICNTEDEYHKIVNSFRNKKIVGCWTMMCSRNCCDKLTSFDTMNLLLDIFTKKEANNTMIKIALDYFICHDKEFKCYLPILVYNLKYNSQALADFLIERCINNFNLLHTLYWELQLYLKDKTENNIYLNILDKLKELFKEKTHENNFIKILESYSFVKVIENISIAICDESKEYDEIKDSFNLKGPLVCPLNHTSKIKNIHVEKIKFKESATKPLLIPCETQNGNLIKILYKREDVRKDQLIMNLIQLIDIILKKEEGLDLGIVTYNILPINQTSGIIEIVHDCETIYYIQETLKSSILNYILEDNGDKKIKDIRGNFIKSTAVFCVITYILGIGDRHLDNIMVTKEGKLFHIDYGYILGNDPVVNNPGIRITPEIIEAIGGLSSKNYTEFTELCTTIYNCLRRHTDIFMTMLNIIPKVTNVKITEKEINDLLLSRLIPGENKIDAKMHLVKQLEKSNYLDKIKDWIHYHSKEKTISSAMNRLTFSLSNLINFTKTESNKPIGENRKFMFDSVIRKL
jgi:hypothetical protein